jgi:phage shock protein PspC (stress-responsive transcriptional regulator)
MTKLSKCKENKQLFGVCCGIARSIGLDATIVRIGFVVGTIITGSILFWMYLLMAVVMPKDE